MGTEIAWVPLVLAAVGTAASVYNTQRTAKKQDNALAAQIEAASKKEREAGSRTKELVDQQTASTPGEDRNKALSQYVQALKSGGGSATAGLTGPKGAVSDEYERDAADAALGVTNYGEKQAGLFSTVDAATRQREREGFERARAASDLRGIDRSARAKDFLMGLKSSSIRRNPYIDAGAQALSAYAGSMGGGTAGAAATDTGALTGVSPVYQGYNPLTGSAFGTWGQGWLNG